MTEAILKYELQMQDAQIIWIPKPAKVLSVINQKEKAVLYAVAEKSSEAWKKSIAISVMMRGTGHDFNIPLDHNFLGTVSFMGGSLIFHFFYRKVEK